MSKELLEQLGFVENHIEFEKEERRVYLPILSEFVKSVSKTCFEKGNTNGGDLLRIKQYTNFITQPLTKGMFIPCGEGGNVLEKPKALNSKGENIHEEMKTFEYLEYQQAEERVLFEGDYTPSKKRNYVYDFSNNKIKCININKYETIEQAINNGVKLYMK